jgi:hypothetical protein
VVAGDKLRCDHPLALIPRGQADQGVYCGGTVAFLCCDDWLIETVDKEQVEKGTFVRMTISTSANWTTRDVFDKYQGEDIYFRKTHLPISLGRYPGEQLVSRSQAKRILARLPEFSEAILDFEGVDSIGQAFADEIFRVFQNEHPDTKLVTVSTNPNIDKMIQYVKSDNSTLPLPLSGAASSSRSPSSSAADPQSDR